MPLTSEIVRTPDAAKCFAAVLRDGERILFAWHVDSWEEGETKILKARDELGKLAAGMPPRSAREDPTYR